MVTFPLVICVQVMDLAAGHVAALSYLNRPLRNLLKGNSTTGKPNGRGAGSYREYSVFNLGTGKGYTVMDIINAMKVIKHFVGYQKSCSYGCGVI